MIDIATMHDLPDRITLGHVAAEAARYPRAFAMLEDLGGWAVYSAADGQRLTERRRNWIATLLDLGMIHAAERLD